MEFYNRISHVKTTPRELLLFFHNVPWKGDIFDSICESHRSSLKTVSEYITLWESDVIPYFSKNDYFTRTVEETLPRFLQQKNDAHVFSQVVLGYYQNLTGLACNTTTKFSEVITTEGETEVSSDSTLEEQQVIDIYS